MAVELSSGLCIHFISIPSRPYFEHVFNWELSKDANFIMSANLVTPNSRNHAYVYGKIFWVLNQPVIYDSWMTSAGNCHNKVITITTDKAACASSCCGSSHPKTSFSKATRKVWKAQQEVTFNCLFSNGSLQWEKTMFKIMYCVAYWLQSELQCGNSHGIKLAPDPSGSRGETRPLRLRI